jgi:hypothetical protein
MKLTTNGWESPAWWSVAVRTRSHRQYTGYNRANKTMGGAMRATHRLALTTATTGNPA